MEITVIVPDSLVPHLEAAMESMPSMPRPGVPGSMDAPDSSPVDLASRLKKQWENEVDQRATNYLIQQAQAEASSIVSSAREAANAKEASLSNTTTSTSKVVTSSNSGDSTETTTK